MRIAFVGFYPMVDAPAIGGVEIAAEDLAEELAAKGHDVLAISPGRADAHPRPGVRNGVSVVHAAADARLGATTGWAVWNRNVRRLLCPGARISSTVRVSCSVAYRPRVGRSGRVS